MRALQVLAVVFLCLAAPLVTGVAPLSAAEAVASVDTADDTLAVDTAVSRPDTTGSRALRVLSTPPTADPTVATHRQRPDVGTSLAVATADATGALHTETAASRIDDADTPSLRQQRILAALDRVDRAETALYDRQVAAIEQHASGAMTDQELLDELLATAALAAEYDARLDRLDTLARQTPGGNAPARLDELKLRLAVYRGPVRAIALDAAQANRAPPTIRVESTPTALVLATIDDDHYVRETLRTDRFDRDGGGDGNSDGDGNSGDISSEAAIDIAVESYPETTDRRQPDAFGAGGIHRITVPHDLGTLQAFVSGGTGTVFAEHQRITLEAFTGGDPVSTTEDGFDVAVHRTYPGGPVAVTVRDESTGEPLSDITVTRSVGDNDSEPVGDTNAEGVVRLLSPAEPYRITVVDEPRVAVIDDVQPLATPRLADETGANETAAAITRSR